MTLTQVTVTASYVTPGAAAPTGTVDFTPYPAFRNTGSNIIVSGTITKTLSSGGFTVTLYATDDTDTVPADDVYYQVVERISGFDERSYLIAVPNTPTSVQLADLPAA